MRYISVKLPLHTHSSVKAVKSQDSAIPPALETDSNLYTEKPQLRHELYVEKQKQKNEEGTSRQHNT